MKVRQTRESCRQLVYLCLQPTREGQASHAHVLEVIAGLRLRDWSIRLIEPPAPSPGRFDSSRRLAHILKAQLHLIVSVLRHRPDVVYIRAHFAAVAASFVLRQLKIPTIQEVNGPIDDAYDAWPWLRRFGRLVRLATSRQLAWACGVIVVTPELAGYVARLAPLSAPPSVIGNGADPERFHPQAIGSLYGQDPYVVFVGALASWQGIGTLLDATRCSEWPQTLQLVVAGDGVDRVLVETAARTGNVKWFPMVPYRDVAGLVARARVAVVPQLASPRARIGLSPLKLFEAMACATPVVVSDLPGLNDVVRATGCGVVVPPGDPRALARAVREMVCSEVEPEEMGKRGRAAVLGQYSWDARAGATDAVLRRVLAPEWAARASGVRHGSSPSDP